VRRQRSLSSNWSPGRSVAHISAALEPARVRCASLFARQRTDLRPEFCADVREPADDVGCACSLGVGGDSTPDYGPWT